MSEKKVDFQKTIEDAFLSYSAFVLSERALPDVRDGLKVGARNLLYSQFHEGLTYDKPMKKAQKSVAAGLSLAYIHGDSSAYGTLIRMGKPFAYRYPLQDVQGNYGTPVSTTNHGASRYVEMRQSELASLLFEGIKKNTVEKWKWNYDDTEKIPTVLPSPFFWNLVNAGGGIGIGVALASSIPTFNLVEVNQALSTLILDPNADFEKLYCPIDFPTGASIINESQVKESLQLGRGKSAVVRATIDYEPKTHMLVVTEMPYMVYTETVCAQLEEKINSEENPGIDRLLDATTNVPRIEIYLNKKSNPDQIKKWLYANSSLQSYYSINMTMLDRGKVPKVFGWKEALEARVAHMREVKRREYEFDLEKAKARLHILEGLLIAIEHIDEFIKIIRNSKTANEASQKMMGTYGLSELQAKAILDLRLARLVSLEYVKVQEEKKTVEEKIKEFELLLSNETLFNQTLIEGLEKVSKKFGDKRRTQNLNIAKEVEEEKVVITEEPEESLLLIYESGRTYSALLKDRTTQKIDLNKDRLLASITGAWGNERALIFTSFGKAYSFRVSDVKKGTDSLVRLLELDSGERILSASIEADPNFLSVIFTKNGLVKVSLLSEFGRISRKGVQSIRLKEEDEVVSSLILGRDDEVIIATNGGRLQRYSINTLTPTGRATQGVKSISLRKDDFVVGAVQATLTYPTLLLTTTGGLELIDINEVPVGSRTTQGKPLFRSDSPNKITKIEVKV